MKLQKKITEVLFTRVVLVHVCFWFLYIAYELFSLYFITGKLEHLTDYISYYSVNILFFYSHLRLMRFVFNRRSPAYIKGALLYLILIVIYLAAKFNTGFLFSTPHLSYKAYFFNFVTFISGALFRAGYFTLLATFYWAAGHIAYYRKQAASAERQQLLVSKDKAVLEARLAETRNAYLKQQLNPHLLFNALNFIYNSVYQQSPDAAKCVLLLSDMMRFSLEESGPDGKVPLSGELEQLGRLLEINRYRYDKPLAIKLLFEGDFENKRIIPLILFTLTENIFKHGNLLDMSRPAELRLTVNEDNRLRFYCQNLKKSKNGYARRAQIGLQNVRVRLDFAYPGKYDLVISETEELYELTLNLSL